MTHFHVIPVVAMDIPLASLEFENYEDSLEAYVRLSTELYAKHSPKGALAIENARAATYKDGAVGTWVGVKELSLVWLRCDSPCFSNTWN